MGKEYVRWHHYVPDKPLQGFEEPANGLIFIFCNYFSILLHCAIEVLEREKSDSVSHVRSFLFFEKNLGSPIFILF